MKYENLSYPPVQKFLDNVNAEIQPLLLTFLNNLLTAGKQESSDNIQLKRDIIAHSIVSFLRPRAFLSKLKLVESMFIEKQAPD